VEHWLDGRRRRRIRLHQQPDRQAQYNYVDLGEDDIGDFVPAVSGGATGSSVTAGLNFKF